MDSMTVAKGGWPNRNETVNPYAGDLGDFEIVPQGISTSPGAGRPRP